MKELYIAMDVHKTSISWASALAPRGRVQSEGTCSSDLGRVEKELRTLRRKHDLEKAQIHLCYEAGPTGFALARHLARREWDIQVIAASKIPTAAGDRIKTDRRDARKLARLFRAGDLTPVHIPDPRDEVIRDFCRARTDAIDARTRALQQLGAFLLRNGHHYKGKSRWTEAHMRYLRELVLQEPIQKMILEDYLQRVDQANERIEEFTRRMELLLEDWDRRRLVEALMGFRGFQLVSAMTVISELGNLLRFEHPRKLMAYLGLVPTEHSTGGKRRQGGITKCGNSHVRWMLVECAHAYRLAPKVSKELSRRQEGLPRDVRALSWKAQQRLSRRYYALSRRGLHHNLIKVALARELAGFIWELVHLLPPPEREQAA